MKRLLKRFSPALLAVLAATQLPLAATTPASAEECAELAPMRYATRTQPSDPLLAYWVIGDKLGYYEEECIASEVVRLDAGEQAVEAGQVELTVSGPDAFMTYLASSQGESDLVAFYNQVPHPHYRLAVSESSGIKSLADLKGKTIATLSNAFSGTTFLKAELTRLGIDPNTDVSIIVIPPGPAAVNALKNDEVQALNYVDSHVPMFEQLLGEKLTILPWSASVEEASGPVWVARRDHIAENHDRYVGYIRAYNKAWTFADANVKAAMEIVVERYPQLLPAGVPREQAIENLTVVFKARHDSARPRTDAWAEPPVPGYMYERSWKTYLGSSEKLPETTDVTKAFDNSLVEASWDFDVEAIRKAAADYELPGG